MEKSKAALLLRTFSGEEIKRFGDFLLSPYFNTNSRVARLFDELKKHYPKLSGRAIEKKVLYKKLFRDKVYNEQVMKNLISELLRLEKEFLSAEHFNADTFNKSLGLLSQLSARPVDMLYEKEAALFEEKARNSEAISVMLNYLLFQMQEINFTHNINRNRQSEVTDNIVKSGENLVIFFLKNIMRLSINININKFSFNSQVPVNLPDKLIESLNIKSVLDYMEMHKIEQTVYLKLLYYAMICNLHVDDDDSYKNYRELLYANMDNLKRDEAHSILHFLESICAQKINSGRHEFYKDLFETYELELSKNLINAKTDTPLTVMKFRNIYLTAMRAGKYQWAEKFINDYKSELHEENKKNIVELALAQLNFEKGDYGKTLQHLHKIKTDQIFFKVDVKVLNLMAFYELEHYESALSLIDSFKRMLSSNVSLTEQYSQKNIAFANSVSSIIKIKNSYDEVSVQMLKEKILKTEVIGNKGWLVKKIEEMINKGE
jgi:hypothetical protein